MDATDEPTAIPPEIRAWADGQDFRATTRRAIQSLRVPPRRKSDRSQPLWAAVMDLLAVGSTYAARYCVLFGFDPDEKVRAA